MNIGKLHQFKEYFWLVYPSKDIAAAVAVEGTVVVAGWNNEDDIVHAANFLRNRFKCNVSYIEPNSIFCLLEQDGKYCKVLTTNGELGWIFYPENEDWTKYYIEEVKV